MAVVENLGGGIETFFQIRNTSNGMLLAMLEPYFFVADSNQFESLSSAEPLTRLVRDGWSTGKPNQAEVSNLSAIRSVHPILLEGIKRHIVTQGVFGAGPRRERVEGI